MNKKYYIEYNLLDIDNNEDEIREKILSAISYRIQTICVPYIHTKMCKFLVKNTDIIVSNAVDYPLGASDLMSRQEMISNHIGNGAEQINIVIQNPYLSSRKYDKIRADIKSNLEICEKKNVKLRYYLEYRVFTHQTLTKVSNIFLENNIKEIYVSTGHMLDDPNDNITASVLLKEKTGIETIFNGKIWTKKHVENLIKNKINNISVYNSESLKLLSENLPI
jgi:deoxyribose-phosphate aldolase